MPSQYQPSGGHFRHLFTALFSLTMAGTCLSFVLWLMSMPIMFCCGRRFHRLPGASMSTFTLLNFLVTIAAFIIGLVLAISYNKALPDGWYGKVGNSIWTLLGAMGCLLLGYMSFMGTCVGGPRDSNRNRVADPESGYGGGGMFHKKDNRYSKTAAPPSPHPQMTNAPPAMNAPPTMNAPPAMNTNAQAAPGPGGSSRPF